MSDEQNQRPQQPDFFSDLMFGRPPTPENRESETHSNQQQTEQNHQPSAEGNEQQNGDQLANIIALVQSLSPYLVKLAPLASKFSTLFNQEDEKESSSKKKKDNE
ncbi:hypothetical protein [Halalkalibacter okhensis]|uniref:Uncharacterized protein n=1 Tax=Halalkalibacter okhensis TaxID=333138 RepID=A0A0B0IC41_9BACI|nr:hypothetical protein [Halalkalibacter okhensis]KHF38407.1 hypothetical protein LQ50_21290 [Halalkalibacter okhensis]